MLMRFVLAALFVSGISAAQTLRRPLATVYTATGAYSVAHADLFSFTANQAALARQKNTAVGVFAERRFMLAELNYFLAAAAIPAGPGTFGTKLSYAGFSDFNELQAGIAYARPLGKKLDAGAMFHYNKIRISSGYGSASAISVEAGMVLHLSDQLHAGLHAANPVGGKFGKNREEKLSSLYSFGIGYDASAKFFAAIELVREERQPVSVQAAIQYKMIPQLMARAGVSTATSTAWMGLGLFVKSFRVDVSCSVHPRLGITPGLLLLFEQGKKGQNK